MKSANECLQKSLTRGYTIPTLAIQETEREHMEASIESINRVANRLIQTYLSVVMDADAPKDIKKGASFLMDDAKQLASAVVTLRRILGE
jgi:hypothetical protein